MTNDQKHKVFIEQKENEVRVWDEEHDPETKEKLLLLTKIDIIIKNRIKELTNAQVWYIRSEIGTVLTFRIAKDLAETMYEELYKVNYAIIKPIQSEINKKISSEYPFTHNDLILSINREYSGLESRCGDFMQDAVTSTPLSKYLANKLVMDVSDNIWGKISDWKHDLINLIESDIENLCGFTHGDMPGDEVGTAEGE
jgi:hypothetical protein